MRFLQGGVPEEKDANTVTKLWIAQMSIGKFLERLKQHSVTYCCLLHLLYIRVDLLGLIYS